MVTKKKANQTGCIAQDRIEFGNKKKMGPSKGRVPEEVCSQRPFDNEVQ